MKAVNYTWGQWKWDLADKEFNETLKLNPNMSEAQSILFSIFIHSK